MDLVCPLCRSSGIDIRRSLALGPTAEFDEFTIQAMRCARCGLCAVATYEEARHGTLQSERVRHTAYRLDEGSFQDMAALLAECPERSNPRCPCPIHRRLAGGASGQEVLSQAGLQVDHAMRFDLAEARPAIEWDTLELASCKATHIPRALLGLLSSDPSIRRQSYWQLDNHVVLQSDLYEAAYFVVAPLLSMLRLCVRDGRDLVYDLLYEIAAGAAPSSTRCRTYEGDELSLADACHREVTKGLDLFRRDLADPDAIVRRKATDLLAVLATGAREELLAVVRQARALLARPQNDFGWSGWEDARAPLRELERQMALLETGEPPDVAVLSALLSGAGPIQDAGLSSGWPDAFTAVAARFDAALERLESSGPALRDEAPVRSVEHSETAAGAMAWAFRSDLSLKEMKKRLDAVSVRSWHEGDSDYRPDYIGGSVAADAVARIFDLGNGGFVVNLVLRATPTLGRDRVEAIRRRLVSKVLGHVEAREVEVTQPYE